MISKFAKTLFGCIQFSDQFSFKQETYKHLENKGKHSRIKFIVFQFCTLPLMSNIAHNGQHLIDLTKIRQIVSPSQRKKD